MLSFTRMMIVWFFTTLPSHTLMNRILAKVFRYFGAKIGKCKVFSSNVPIKGDVRIGKHCNFNEYVMLASTGKGKILIGYCTIVGPNVVVLPGASIGDCAVIGAEAVVRGTIPAYAIAVGVPAKVIRSRLDKSPGEREIDAAEPVVDEHA